VISVNTALYANIYVFHTNALLTIHPTGFSTTAGYDELRGGDCTSCSVAQDKSAYWHPALYFKATNGQITAVNEVGGMLA
jgi:hypothetical protein